MSACILEESIVKQRLLVSGSCRALARDGDYKMHPVRACMHVCVSVSHRFLQNCYSYRFLVN